jgi:hypothetical protein
MCRLFDRTGRPSVGQEREETTGRIGDDDLLYAANEKKCKPQMSDQMPDASAWGEGVLQRPGAGTLLRPSGTTDDRTNHLKAITVEQPAQAILTASQHRSTSWAITSGHQLMEYERVVNVKLQGE